MNKQIEELKATVLAIGRDGCPIADAVINGRNVRAYAIFGYRNTGAKKNPSIKWYVDGKVVSFADLQSVIGI